MGPMPAKYSSRQSSVHHSPRLLGPSPPAWPHQFCCTRACFLAFLSGAYTTVEGLGLPHPRYSPVDPSGNSDRKANLLSLNVLVQKPVVPQQDPALLAELSVKFVLMDGTTIPQPRCFPHWAGRCPGPRCAVRHCPPHAHSEGSAPTSREQ